MRGLAGIVVASFAARAVAIWLTRPEFVGWFNHSYYYWVQVKGLMEQGRLPYTDMPLTFELYRGVAVVFRLFGSDTEAAIVNTSRFVMSLAPALIAVPVYFIVKEIRGSKPFDAPQWIVVASSAFLPLTFVHVPEMLQKNCLGLFLLAMLIFTTYRLVRTKAKGAMVACGVLFLLIVFTHIGTLAAALFFGIAMVLAARPTVRGAAVVAGASAFGLLAVYVLDAEAYERIVGYARSTLALRAMTWPVVLFPLVVFAGLLRLHAKYSATLPVHDRSFWLGCTIFAYLLVFPVLDLDLLPRFALFLPIPVIVILSYTLEVSRRRAGLFLSGIAGLGILLMTFGEVMSLVLHDPHKAAIHRELLELKRGQRLTQRDFVLTRYAVNPICNWFLGTRSGLVTAFDRSDFDTYDRFFVLNPVAGSVEMPGDPTRANVPLPPELQPVVGTEHLAFYKLDAAPDDW